MVLAFQQGILVPNSVKIVRAEKRYGVCTDDQMHSKIPKRGIQTEKY